MNFDKVAVLGAGFIGKNLISSLYEKSNQIRVLDHNECPEIFKNNVEWIQGSFLNNEELNKSIKGVDTVFHLISSTVPGDVIDEGEEIKQNVLQTINLLKMCIKENVKRIIFISSSSVYGAKEKLPISEAETTDPISSHGINKLVIEKYLQLYKSKYKLDCKIMRLSNPYGQGQNVYGRQGFVAIVIGKILTNSPILIRGNGEAIRDYINIFDVVKACELLAKTDSEEVIYNVGSGTGTSLNGIIESIESILKMKLNLKYTEERNEDIPASVLDISKARKLLGFEPSISLTEGLMQTLNYYNVK